MNVLVGNRAMFSVVRCPAYCARVSLQLTTALDLNNSPKARLPSDELRGLLRILCARLDFSDSPSAIDASLGVVLDLTECSHC